MKGLPLYEVSPGEEIRFQVFGTCSCGSRLDRSFSESEELGTISLLRLIERAMAEVRSLACQVCGELISRQEGVLCASYRMPGFGPFIVAEVTCQQPSEVFLSLRKRMPLKPGENIIAHLASSSELDTVVRLGAPVSVRAAWHEALFEIEMGIHERSFQAGPGLRLIASKEKARDHHFNLGRIPAFREQLEASCRAAIDEEKVFCFALIDSDAAADVIVKMAAHYGLGVIPSGPEQLMITRKNGEFSIGLDLRELLVQAAVHSLTLAAAADPALGYCAARLVAAEETKQMIEASFSLSGDIEDGKLVFTNDQGRILFDIDTYIEESHDNQEAMLTHLRLKLGFGL